MSSGYIDIPVSGGGPSAGVSSINSLFGSLTLLAGTGISITQTGPQELTLANTSSASFPLLAPIGTVGAPSYSFTGDTDTGIYSTGNGNLSLSADGIQRLQLSATGADIIGDLGVTGNITAANFPTTGTNNTLAYFNNSGALDSLNNYFIDPITTGMDVNITVDVEDNGGHTLSSNTTQLNPIEDSPTANWNIHNTSLLLDNADSGFTMAIGGVVATVDNTYIQAHGTSSMGAVNVKGIGINIGNGTDPIDFGGINFFYAQGQINSGVNVTGQISGFGFQIQTLSGATLAPGASIRAFYDNADINGATHGYQSFQASPNIDSIANNSNYAGLDLNPTIPVFTGNANFNGVSVAGTLGTFGTGSFNGVNINPNITLVNYAVGINVTMDNVIVVVGVSATSVIQDLTVSFNEKSSFNNSYFIEYTPGAIAGSEVVTTVGFVIAVQIESGVSTATQVKAALDADITFASNLSATITGVGSNAQVTGGPIAFSGGIDSGRKLAAYFDGDVEITGGLIFGGALSIGALSSFAPVTLASNLGVLSVSTLITQPTIAANATIVGTDLLGVNTAALFNIGDNATYTSNFLGLAALGLPAVVTMGVGSTVDRISGATFVVSLDVASTGGTINEIDLARVIAIPNGVTTVNRLIGYKMDLPFGDPGTLTWGVYITPAVANYFAGSVVVGTTDTPTNASVGIELNSTAKAILNARMTTTQKLALTAVAGMQVYDTTLNKLSYYDGSAWVNI